MGENVMKIENGRRKNNHPRFLQAQRNPSSCEKYAKFLTIHTSSWTTNIQHIYWDVCFSLSLNNARHTNMTELAK